MSPSLKGNMEKQDGSTRRELHPGEYDDRLKEDSGPKASILEHYWPSAVGPPVPQPRFCHDHALLHDASQCPLSFFLINFD